MSLTDTPYYHCIGRCVRRSYLCGKDPVSGRNFDHRKGIILERLKLLTETFAIDLCAYALMSNHYHLVVKLEPKRAAAWTEEEVAKRWRRLYRGSHFVEAWLEGAELTNDESARLEELIALWRRRLGDLSWFMRCLNEYIARLANAEDECTGRFWEGRFKSQALLDEQALLAAMAYVDLNPVRAGFAESIESSAYTSGQQRLHEAARRPPLAGAPARPALLALAQAMRADDEGDIPFNLQDYLDLLDSSGRCIRPATPNITPATTPRLLTRFGIEHAEWLKVITTLHTRFRLFIGAPARLRTFAQAHGWRWVRGHAAARALYRAAGES
ncbi:MAG TPA: transposase [Gammaproteobacteria bacterium]|nr:transposase [Gammaproteobacteria bacterium]